MGLRLAYALTTSTLATHLVNLQPAWVLPGPLADVLTALPTQGDFLQRTLPQVRQWAADLAQARGATPTGIHFFTVAVPDAPRVVADLLTKGIRVRDCTSFGLRGHIRIATRTPGENARLLMAWPL